MIENKKRKLGFWLDCKKVGLHTRLEAAAWRGGAENVTLCLYTTREQHNATQQNRIEPIIISDALYTGCGTA